MLLPPARGYVGRMASSTSKKTRAVLVNLDRSDWALLRRISEVERLPKTEVVRRALRVRGARLLKRPERSQQPST